MSKWLKLMEADGTGGGGSTAATSTVAAGTTNTSTASTDTSSTSEYKWEFKDPEIKENFGKMFPGMKSVEDLAKTAIHQQRKIGQQGVQLPTKPEEFTAWAQTHLKAPKDGKGYDLKSVKVPEGLKIDEAGVGAFADTFAKLGLTQTQVAGVLENYYGMASQQESQSKAQRDTLAKESTAALQKKYGGDFESKKNSAEIALTTLGGPEMVKIATDLGMVNHAPFIEFLVNAAELMKEDPISGKLSGGGLASGPVQASQEIDLLYANMEFMKAYNNPNHAGHKSAQEQMDRLYKIKHGELGRRTV